MADSGTSSLLCLEDIPSWIQSVVDYVKNTQANCLDLRTVNLPWILSFKTAGVDIQPVLDSLVNSVITECCVESVDLADKVQDFSKILVKTKIETLNLLGFLEVDDLLSLMAILKNTSIIELDVSVKGKLTIDQADEFCALLVNSHLRSLKLSNLCILPFEKISVLSQTLPYTQITCLGLTRVFSSESCSSPKIRAELLHTLMLNLQCSVLTDLNLSSNCLDDSSVRAICVVLRNSKLEKLDLSDNCIKDSGVNFLVHNGLVHSKITRLNLSSNQINGLNDLGDSLKDTKIRDLDLSNNKLTDGKMFSGPNFLHGSSVADLRLSMCKRSNENVIDSLIGNLRFSAVTCLDLSFDKLSLEHIPALAVAVRHSNITHLDLSCNQFSAECLIILGECLRTSVLKFINLNETTYGRDWINGIASFLDKSKGSTLAGVDIGCNAFEVDDIAPNLTSTTFLALDFSGNKFTNGMRDLAPQLKSTAITALYLGWSKIRDDSISVLAKHLKETQIVLLDLSANSITCRGAKSLAVVLERTKLRYLGLKANEIGDDGCESLAEHAKNSCISYLNIESNPTRRSLLIDRVLWENRRKIQQFADLLKETAFFTGDSNIFEFDRNFTHIDVCVFIENHLKLYKMVSEEPYVVGSIEQDKCILDMKKLKFSHFKQRIKDDRFKYFIENCEAIYSKILEYQSPVQGTAAQSSGVSFFKNQILWLVLELFPTKFASFVGRSIEADVDQHVFLLRNIEELGLPRIVELLLLNRPAYVIDMDQNILHPFVYKLLHVYKQPICNLDIEPGGVEKIITYFSSHLNIDGASEVISLLSGSKSS